MLLYIMYKMYSLRSYWLPGIPKTWSFFVTHTSYTHFTHIRNILTYIWQICMTHVHSQWPVARPFMRVAHGRVPWLLWMQWRPRLMSHQWDHWAVCYITKTRHMCTFPLAPGAHAKPRGTLGGPVMKPNVQVLLGDLSFYKCLISGTFFGMSTDLWKQQQYYNHETWILKFSWNGWQFPAPCIHSELAKANLYNAIPFRHLCSTHTWQDIPLIGFRTEAREVDKSQGWMSQNGSVWYWLRCDLAQSTIISY